MTQIWGYSIPVPSWLILSLFAVGWVLLSISVSLLFDKYVRFESFKKEGIEIPFPERTVHLRKGEN